MYFEVLRIFSPHSSACPRVSMPSLNPLSEPPTATLSPHASWSVPAADRPGEPQLLGAAVRESERDTPPHTVQRRSPAAGAGRGRESPPRELAEAGRAAPLQLQEEGTCRTWYRVWHDILRTYDMI